MTVRPGPGWYDGMRFTLKIVLIVLLVVAVALEGSYIVTLRARIERQTEELENISVQLQTLKNERLNLSEELSSLKKSGGENKDENTLRR